MVKKNNKKEGEIKENQTAARKYRLCYIIMAGEKENEFSK